MSFLADSILAGAGLWIDSQLSGSTGAWGLVMIFCGGFLASLLPCTYPLYPVTASLMRNRSGENLPTWTHPLSYYLGLAFIYSLFGLLASFTGGAFNQVMRIPSVNIAVGIIIFLLGLSGLDLIYLPFLGKSSNSFVKSESLFGSFFLGMGAGLLSSPCTGPVVITILLKVTAQSQAGVSISSLIGAMTQMFLFGLGVGLPFLWIGIFGGKLPKSGKWMKSIQYFFSLLIFYFSWTFLEKGFSSLGVSEADRIKIIVLSVFLLYLLYKAQGQEFLFQERVKNAVMLFLSFIVLLFIAGILFSKKESTTEATPIQKEIAGNLEWIRNPEEAHKIALSENKKIFIDFYADWCTNCKTFSKLTLSDTALNGALKKVVLLKIYDTDPVFEEYSQKNEFSELKIGLPFFVILSSDGKLLYKTTDYLQYPEMVRRLSE